MKVLADTESLSAVADAIRAKSGGNEELSFPDGFADEIEAIEGGYDKGYAEGHEKGYAEGETKGEEQGYDQGYGEGYTDGYSKTPLQYTSGLNMAFMSAIFPENYDLILSVPNFKGNLSNTFSQSKNLKSVKLICEDKSGTFVSDGSLYGCEKLELIDLTEFKTKPYNGSLTFANCYRLVEIKGELDYSECASSSITAFGNAWALKEIRFKSESIKKPFNIASTGVLSDSSIQSTIDALADLTGANTQTLSLHADVKATLTEEQLASITQKNWTVA